MIQRLLFDKIDQRVALDKEDGNYAYFHALSLKLEFFTKIVTSGVVACVGEDVDRHRYSLEHKLVRADSLGEWIEALNSALIGPPAQFLDSDAHIVSRDLTVRVGPGDWRHSAVTDLHQAAAAVGAEAMLGEKVALRQFFEIAVQLRNRSRGHGAPTSEQCSKSCTYLSSSLTTLEQNLKLFRLPWVYLHRNLSSKYRVSSLLNSSSSFDYLKRSREVRLPDGVFFSLNDQEDTARPVHVPLIFSDADVLDVALPNGNHKASTFEIISYVTNEVERRDGSAWSSPPARLPKSETEGEAVLELQGNSFTNAPKQSFGYVQRIDLENRLCEELLKSDQHPIISLTGPGGIGKTTIAIAAIQRISEREPVPYQVILWISARDIDLLDSGPKPVSQKVFTQRDIAHAAIDLLEPSEKSSNDFEPAIFFQKCLAHGAAGTTLFVLDNFETVENPADVFSWIDTHIRLPNKILITTRFRDFVGDYPIDIRGMSDDEADKLIDQHASRLNIEKLLSISYKEELIRESDGHPYVIKILLGQVSKDGNAVKPKRIVATSDRLLDALFKRTFTSLSPAGQRVFLLLCSWRVVVPEVAVEAVSLRPSTERFDVAAALDELRLFSLVDQIVSEEEGSTFVCVPLAAAMYGRRELEVSPFKVAVEEDRKLLMEFGAGKRSDTQRGVLPRIDNLIRAVAKRASSSPTDLEEALPVLEYLATRFPMAYPTLAKLVREVDGSDQSIYRAKGYMENFLQTAAIPARLDAWQELAYLRRLSKDPMGEVHALCEAALLSASDREKLSSFANQLNNRIRDLKEQSVEVGWHEGVRELLAKVIEVMEKQIKGLSATDCSRLAWLLLNIGNSERSLDVAKTGIQRESSNEYCQSLILKLESH